MHKPCLCHGKVVCLSVTFVYSVEISKRVLKLCSHDNAYNELIRFCTLTRLTIGLNDDSRTKINKCVSRTDTNPPFAFETAFPRGTDFSVSTARVKKLHTLLVSLLAVAEI